MKDRDNISFLSDKKMNCGFICTLPINNFSITNKTKQKQNSNLITVELETKNDVSELSPNPITILQCKQKLCTIKRSGKKKLGHQSIPLMKSVKEY